VWQKPASGREAMRSSMASASGNGLDKGAGRMAINFLERWASTLPNTAGHRVNGVDGPPADGFLNQVSQPLEPPAPA